MIKGVLLDLAGVIYDGEDAVPGATEAVARLHEAGLLVCFVSNTTRSNKQTVLAGSPGLVFRLRATNSSLRRRRRAIGFASTSDHHIFWYTPI